MIYCVDPNLFADIPDTFLPLTYTDGVGPPIIVAVEKRAIHFDPPGTSPENAAEWEVVTNSIGETITSLVFELLPHNDITRSESGLRWRHLDLTAALLAENGVQLQTQAHYMLRHSTWG